MQPEEVKDKIGIDISLASPFSKNEEEEEEGCFSSPSLLQTYSTSIHLHFKKNDNAVEEKIFRFGDNP